MTTDGSPKAPLTSVWRIP